MNAVGKALVGVVLLAGLALVAGGASMIVQRETGTRATATVSDCVERGRASYCTGSWVVGGDLIGGGGQVVVGPVDGAVSSDVGKEIDVTVSGDHAYSRSLVLPIVLIGLGLVLTAFGGLVLVRAARPRLQPGAGGHGRT